MPRLDPSLLAKSARVLSKIYAHPFNQQLGAGTLPHHTFKFYLEQDALYLRQFAKALGILSTRFDDKRYARQFKLFSDQMVSAELSLHFKHLKKMETKTFFSPQKSLPIKKIPTISDYTNHLLYTAKTAPIAEAVASCVPCFLIYKELGEQMKASCTPSNPYYDWIASYSGERFSMSTQLIIQTTNEFMSKTTCPKMKERICDAFFQSAKFELMFFDAAHVGRPSHEHLPRSDKRFSFG